MTAYNDKIKNLISIHAPARGATLKSLRNFLSDTISIHAPARGATEPRKGKNEKNKNFNPRSREGSDVILICFYQKFIISIHAPARGATVLSATMQGQIINFNPRSREGSDLRDLRVACNLTQFQSTLPRGERPLWPKRKKTDQRFQSTLPRGERHVWTWKKCFL